MLANTRTLHFLIKIIFFLSYFASRLYLLNPHLILKLFIAIEILIFDFLIKISKPCRYFLAHFPHFKKKCALLSAQARILEQSRWHFSCSCFLMEKFRSSKIPKTTIEGRNLSKKVRRSRKLPVNGLKTSEIIGKH